MYIKIIGFIAAALTTISFIPQAAKTWKTRSTDDLSPTMFSLFCVGILGWLTYGILRNDIVIIIANMITILFAGTILYFIIKKKKTRKITHLGLWVEQLEDMKSFYIKHFGASAGSLYQNKEKGFSSYFLTFSSGARLELMHTTNSNDFKTKNWGHLALSVGHVAEVDNLTRKLEKEGVKIHSQPRTTGDGYYESVVSDPEGNLIEITV